MGICKTHLSLLNEKAAYRDRSEFGVLVPLCALKQELTDRTPGLPEHQAAVLIAFKAGVAVPILVQFFIKHILIGFGLAAVFVGMLLGFDVMGLRGMIAREEYWPSALFNLCFGNATVFGAVQVAYAVMSMAED